MKYQVLKSLVCPYCGAHLCVDSLLEETKDGQLDYGIIKCNCDLFPVLDGILILIKSQKTDQAVRLLKKGKKRAALALYLSISNELLKRADRVNHRTSLNTERIIELFLRLFSSSISKRHDPTRSKHYYYSCRFALQSFVPVYPFCVLAKERNERVLDLCCGRGYTSFAISTYTKPRDLLSLDVNFADLFIAKNYCAPDAEYVCADANVALPFESNAFSTVFLVDAFHYIQSKGLLANELERITMPDGLILLLHVHNADVEVPYCGSPLPFWGYTDLFNSVHVRTFAEQSVIWDFLVKDTLSLQDQAQDIALSDALCLIGSKSESIFKEYAGIWKHILENKDNLTVNSIYEVHKEGVLVKRALSTDFKNEYYLTDALFPDRASIDLNRAKLTGNAINIETSDAAYLDELMKRLIIMNYPPKLTRNGQET